MPLSFEPNRGQTDAATRFISHSAGYSLALDSVGARFQFAGHDKSTSPTVRMDMVNANREAIISGEDQLLGKADYFPTRDHKSWITDVPTYGRVRYTDIYPGVDVAFYGVANRLEYDFVVRPNADPKSIQMSLSGSDKVSIDAKGDLIAHVGKGDLRFLKPVVYQLSKDGKTREAVNGDYVLNSETKAKPAVSFMLGKYDHSRQLVIDPVVALNYSQLLPSYAGGVAVDGSGNTYVTGTTYNNGFYVTKFNASGAVVYNASLGTGPYEFTNGIAISNSGEAYVSGVDDDVSGTTLPTSANAYQASSTAQNVGFLTVLSANGASVVYGTYLGGTDSSTSQNYSVAVDSNGNAYLTGATNSSTFPVTSGVYQTAFPGGTTGYVAKINPAASTGSASLVYSTYLGTSNTNLYGVAVDSSGDAYVTGNATNGYPVTAGAFQYTGLYAANGGAYVTKLNPTATALVYSAYLGPVDGNSIAVEGQSSPSAYITGSVNGVDFPVTTGAYQTSYAGGFVTKLNSTGSALVYSTLLGGPSSYGGGSSVIPATITLPYGCSSSCNAYVAGSTRTTDFPQINPIQTKPQVNNQSGFVTEIAAAGTSALFSSYVNGLSMGVDSPNIGSAQGQTPAIAVDSTGNISYVADTTNSIDFPITIVTSNPGYAFLARISPSSSAATFAVPTKISFGSQPVGVSTTTYNNAGAVTLYNLSSTPATLGTIQTSPSSVYSESDNCYGQIAAGGSCTLQVNFDPNTPSTRNGTITIPSNAANSPTTIALTGTGYDTPFLQTSPTTLTFGNTTVGTSSTSQTVTITNIGDQTTSINATVASPDFATLDNCPAQLLPGASCTATITFSPTQAGLRTDRLTLANSGPYEYVSLNGTAVVSGTSTLEFNGASLQFDPQVAGTTSGQVAFYVTNTGTYPVVIQAVTASGDFSITYQSPGAAPVQLNPQQQVQYNVVFAPTAAGARTGAITFTDDASGTSQQVSLSGTGLQSTNNVEFYPSSAVSFPDTPVGVQSGSQTIYFENTGTNTATIDRVVPSGPFQITYSSCEAATIGGADPDGLGSAGYCQVNVAFTPTATGAQTGTLTFTDSAPGSPHVVSLMGNGVTATGTIALSPDGVTFSTQANGTTSGPQYFYFRNPGDSSVTVSSFTITGANPSDFTVGASNCGSTPINVSSGSTGCYIPVQFTPTAAGSRTATFNVNSSAGNTTATLSGTGVAASQAIGLTPASSMPFGSIVVGQSASYDSVYIRNTGTATVTFSATATITGTNAADFNLSNGCATSGNTVAPGAVCAISINFAPTATGTRSATLTLSDSAGTQTLALSGTGGTVPATYTVTYSTLNYSTQVQGTTSPTTVYTYFNNNGSSPVTLGNVSISGSFLVPSGDNSCNGKTIAANSSCYVYVSFAPTATGYQTGTLTFNGTSGTAIAGAPVVALAGYSTAPVYTSYVDPTALNFTGLQVVGTTSGVTTMYLYNNGNLPLQVGTLTGTDFGVAGASAEFSIASANGGYDGCSGQSIAAGSYCQVNVTFTPNATGTRTGSISFPVTYANNTTTTLTASLSGTGVAEKKSAVLTPPNGSFIDQVVSTTTTYNVTTYLVNSGNQPFTLGTLTNTDSPEFSTASSVGGYDGCSGQTIQPGSSCQINVRFTPSATGKRTGTIGFPVTFADHTTVTDTFALTGTGVASANTIAISPASIQFSTEIQGVTSSSVGLTVTNTGNSTVTIGTDSISTNSAEFAIPQDNCSGVKLTPNQTCAIYVNFKPGSSATGVQTGVLTIADNATGGPHTVALSGTAIPASQQVVLSQTAVAFGNQPAASTSSARVVYVTNQGDTAVSINSIVLGGTNAVDFTTSNNCSSLNGHSGCAITIAFAPVSGASGNLTATMTETDSANPGTHTISLTGTAVAPGPAAALSPTTLSFSSQTVGTTSAAQSFSVTNTGSASLIVSGVSSTNSAEFPISVDGCSGTTLAPNQHCVVSVKFSPTLGGTRTGSVQVVDNATGSPQTVSVTGIGYGNPAVTLTPTSLTFSSTNIGSTSATQTITLKDTGTDTLNISSIALTGANAGDFAQTNNCPSKLTPAASCVITVSFKPTASGSRGASVTVTDNAGNVSGAMQTAALTGTGTAVPTAAVSPTTLTFSNTNIGVTSAAQTSTLTNSGTGPLSIASIAVGGTNASDYSQTNNCGSTLNAGTSCTISVSFKPTASGTRTATVTITDNASNTSGSTQTVSLTGTGTGNPSAALSPTVVSFSNTNVGVTTSAQTVTLTNSGTGPLTIASVTITGTNPGDFSQTNNCGSSLAAGANCTISIKFDPTAPGNRAATLTVTDNSGNVSGTTQTASLSGTGVGNPVAAVSPSSLTFPTTNPGTTTAAQNVTLSNTGTGPLTITSITLTGTNPGDFAETNTCGSSLAANASCTISVTFDPTAGGSRTGTLQILDNSGNAGATQNVSLSGTGATPPSAAVSPNSLTFSSQNVGTTSAAQTVTLSNSGSSSLSIASVAFSGTNSGDFSQTNNCGSTLAGGASCTISVTFAPTATGSRTANLVVTDNSGNTNGSTQSVSLMGTGVGTPAVTLSPTTLNFPSTQTGSSSTLALKITNSGTATLNITAISNTGANPSLFTHTSNCGGNPLAPGSYCTAQITFKPTAAGTFTATLNITDNATNSPQTVALTGTGTAGSSRTPSAPAATLSSTSLSFPASTMGTTSTKSFTITNSGSATLNVSAINATGQNPSNFTHTSNCGGNPLAPGRECTVQVSFTPSTSGSFSATMNITDNAPGPPRSVTLSGTGN